MVTLHQPRRHHPDPERGKAPGPWPTSCNTAVTVTTTTPSSPRHLTASLIQGGGYAWASRPALPIKNRAANGLSTRSAPSPWPAPWSRTSASAQFFINVNNNDFLDFKSATTQGFGVTACSVK